MHESSADRQRSTQCPFAWKPLATRDSSLRGVPLRRLLALAFSGRASRLRTWHDRRIRRKQKPRAGFRLRDEAEHGGMRCGCATRENSAGAAWTRRPQPQPVACAAVSRNRIDIERRVARVAEAALAERKFVSAIEVLVGMGWLEPRRVDAWRQGRVDCLERVVGANLGKISTAMRAFRRWAQARGLKPSETVYLTRTRDRRRLRFSVSGDPEIERSYRTHWVSPELSERKRARIAEHQIRPAEIARAQVSDEVAGVVEGGRR